MSDQRTYEEAVETLADIYDQLIDEEPEVLIEFISELYGRDGGAVRDDVAASVGE